MEHHKLFHEADLLSSHRTNAYLPALGPRVCSTIRSLNPAGPKS